MIVGPHKGVFFVATALMCSASLYGAELSAPGSDPLTRIFVGEPTRLTLPPGFPDAAEVSLDEDESCAPRVADRSLGGATLSTASALQGENTCRRDEKSAPGTIVLPGAVTALEPELSTTPAGVEATTQAH